MCSWEISSLLMEDVNAIPLIRAGLVMDQLHWKTTEIGKKKHLSAFSVRSRYSEPTLGLYRVSSKLKAQGSTDKRQLLLPNHYCTQQGGSCSQGNNKFATCISRLHSRSLSLAHRSSSLPIIATVPNRKQKHKLPLTFSLLPPFPSDL